MNLNETGIKYGNEVTDMMDEYMAEREAEAENQRKNIAIVLRALIKRCSEKFITFESRYSSDGFENDGVLTKLF